MRTITDIKKPVGGFILVVAVLALIVSGCGNDDDEAGGGGLPAVMATTSIWADVVANVACDGLADVITLIPPGGDPHAFQPSLQDRGRMEAAVMIVANGLDLEEGLEDTIDAVEEAGTPVFYMADHIATIGFAPGMELEHHDEEEEEEEEHHDEEEEEEHHDEEDGDEHHDEEEEEEEHGHGAEDPHVWFDPIRVADALPALSRALASEAGLDAAALDACVSEYRGELMALDAEIDEILASLSLEERLLVTNHDALGYFADRYQFELVGTVIPGGTSVGAANPAELQELIGLIGQTGVTAIFAESSHSSQDAEALGREADVQVVTLDTGSLGPAGSDSDTYISYLRINAQKIAEGLG